MNGLNDLNSLNPSKSMNVLLITGIFPPDIGGPATYVPTIADELVKRGHKVAIVTLSDKLHHNDGSYSFSVHRVRRDLLKPLRFLFTVGRILREGRSAQVLYVNGLYLETVIANLLLRKPMVQKIVGDWAWERSTDHGWVKDNFDEFQTRKHGLKVEVLKTLRKFCARRADALIVPSRYLARSVAGWGVAESKTIVIHNAVELPSATPSTPLLPARINVVTVGRLVPWKKVDHLIEAIAECKETGLVVVGDGPERTRLEEFVRDRQLVHRVYFAGHRSKAETLSLMASCDLFVLNSTYEGFPHVVLEAMSVGLPVVATAVGGTSELVRNGENGVLIPPTANGLLSSTIAELIASPAERGRLASGGRQTLKRFRHSVMVQETETVLQSRAYRQRE